MSRYKKEEQNKYNKKINNMTTEDKKNYDLLLGIQENFNSLVNKLHVKLFPEEYDFMYDSSTEIKRRKYGENPMSEEYIEKMNNKRIKLGFLPLNQNGYAQDSNETKEHCKKLIVGEIEYEQIEVN